MKASDNPFPSLLLVEQATAPATPSAGEARLYRGTDNKLYVVDDAGAVTEVGGGAGGSANGEYEIVHLPYPGRIDTSREVLTGTWAFGTPSVATAIGDKFYYNTSNAQNDSFGLRVWLSPGTYQLTVHGTTDTNRAIQTWEVDDGAGAFSTIGTMDWYAAPTYDVKKQLTFTVAGALARRTIRARSATRNASATGWYQGIQRVAILRTA